MEFSFILGSFLGVKKPKKPNVVLVLQGHSQMGVSDKWVQMKAAKIEVGSGFPGSRWTLRSEMRRESADAPVKDSTWSDGIEKLGN